MTEQIICHGMVLKATPVGEYDKRLVILTKERGKIAAFARGARRAKSLLAGSSQPFCIGKFKLYAGKDAYSLTEADIDVYFHDITADVEATCYGCYFLELADYFLHEGMESEESLKLLYASLKALLNPNLPNPLVKCIFELKMLVIHGEYPQMFTCMSCESEEVSYFSAARSGVLCEKCCGKAEDAVPIEGSTVYTMQYIIVSEIDKLYTFIVKEYVQNELEFILKRYFARYVEGEFHSLEILRMM